jgi:tetratricopeptide (TPR) repeat protein
MSARLLFSLVFAASTVALPAALHAQGKDRFVRSLTDFSNAVAGARGDEGPTLGAALDGMEAGLREWDGLVAKVEAGFSAAVGTASPPEAARMRTALGTVYLERGRTDDALEQFDAAVRLDPEFADVYLLRALAYELLIRPDDAVSAYRSLWQKSGANPAYAYLFLRSAGGNENGRDRASAMQVLTSAVDEARAGTGALFATVGVIDDTASGPVFAPAAYAEGFALLRSNQYDAAVVRLRAALSSDPLIGGIAAPDPAVRRSLQDERARLAAADGLMASGDLEAARELLARTAEAIPKSGTVHWLLGTLCQRLGDEACALGAFQGAATIAPLAGAGRLHAAIARLHHNRLDLDAATVAYRHRVALTPNDSTAHLDLGDVYRAKGSLDAALIEFLVGALLDPSSARAFAGIGQIHAAAGRDDEAAAMLRRAIAVDGSHLEARYALSRALLRLGRMDEARKELEAYEQLHAKAMEEERRRFKENQIRIEQALETSDPAERRR